MTLKWYQKLAIEFALKGMIKACEKLANIEKFKNLDLDANDVNDLIEWATWCRKALKNIKGE